LPAIAVFGWDKKVIPRPQRAPFVEHANEALLRADRAPQARTATVKALRGRGPQFSPNLQAPALEVDAR
jgi:hypothetical protein